MKVEEGTDEDDRLNSVDVFRNSMCMNCGGTGTTRMLMHKIPYFREVIIASFCCEYCPDLDDAEADTEKDQEDGDEGEGGCGYTNNEVTFGGEIQPKGCRYEIVCKDKKDLDRQLIKSDSATVILPSIDFEIPPHTQKGEISTIEGMLSKAAKNLSLHQAERMEQTPEVGIQVARIISSLTMMSMAEDLPFTIVVEDSAGNSFIENPYAPAKDPSMKVSYFERTREQNEALGLSQTENNQQYNDENDMEALKNLMSGGFGQLDISGSRGYDVDSGRLGRNEIIRIPQPCPSCYEEGEALTAVTDIPHFKEVIIMAFNCSSCGFRNNEIKGGGAVPTYGNEVTLTVETLDDMKRDVLKSDSAMVKIPELDLELQHGTLGGVYTTVEGLLSKLLKNLTEDNPFCVGDSSLQHHSEDGSITEARNKFDAFTKRLQAVANGEYFPFTLIIRDPLGNSFVSTRLGSTIPPELDPNLKMRDFERTWEENEDIGLNDMNTRDFETGVDHDDTQISLPDRLTHVLPKGEGNTLLIRIEKPCPSCLYCFSSLNFFPYLSYYHLMFTFHMRKCSDHPTVFAMGANDDVECGVYFESTDKANTSIADKFSGRIEEYPVRTFDEDDESREFEAREEFAGRRDGFIFRLGSKGLGYYGM